MCRILYSRFFLLAIFFVLCVAHLRSPISTIAQEDEDDEIECTLTVITQDKEFTIPAGFNIPSSPIGGYTHDFDCPRNDMRILCNANWVSIEPDKFEVEPGGTEPLTVHYNTGLLPVGSFEAFCTISGETTEPQIDLFANFELTVLSPSEKLFTFNCKKPFQKWPVSSFERLDMDLGDRESCTLRVLNYEPGEEVKVSTNKRRGLRSAINVDPISGVVDEDGHIDFTITALKEGIYWLSWAVANENGEFEFDKEAYDEGRAWGMFVDVK